MLIGLPYETMTFLPIYVAHEKRFFADEGVAVDYLYGLTGGYRGSKRKVVELCLSGDLAFFDGVSTAIEAQLLGLGDVKTLVAGDRRGSSMFARPSIQTVADLRGKRIMAGGGASLNEVLYLARENGWQIDRDIFLVPGDETARTTAFANPSIDAVCGRSMYKTYAEQHGFHVFQLPGASWLSGGLATSTEMIRSQPDVVQAVVNAYVRALAYIKLNKDEVVAIGERNIRWLDQAEVAEHYNNIDFAPDLTEDGLRWMIGLLGVAKSTKRDLTPSDVADWRFVGPAMEKYWSE